MTWSHLVVVFGKASGTGFFVKGWEVMAGFFHDSYEFVERYAVDSVGQGGIDIGVEGAGCGIGVALDAWNLHQTAHRVASHAEMMFQPHFSGIFNLGRAAAEELQGCRGCHGAGHTYFSLTADLGAGDAGILFDDVAY